jgi:hypothetical protein
MYLTFNELLERLRQLDEITLVEELGLTSEDLIDRFSDVIETKQDKLKLIVDWD